MEPFDVFVVGGGHAGLEAAWAAEQFDLRVGLAALPGVGLASTPCNPAVGGAGKGQVVRELDALGGLMGRLADLAGIQYRTLNESKGHAVQSTRVQVDKELYSRKAEEIVGASSIVVVRKKVVKVVKKGCFELFFEDGSKLAARKLIVTAGTFFGGVLHTGSDRRDGGRRDHQASPPLKEFFPQVKTLGKRFKTGTPARLGKDSLRYSAMREQKSDVRTMNFHFAHGPYRRFCRQISCYLTQTNPRTMALIRESRHLSPLFNGQIEGVGPRYCPSIEDKAFRYPERDRHLVFIEPEGHEISTVYPNGVSTSLPVDIQEGFYRSIEGLEQCQFEAYGYAVEYDVLDTSRLSMGLEYRDVPGLYFAGQLNGTSGYEEAAGQGLVAGVNAAFAVMGRGLFVLPRDQSYIGVMVEDLVTQKRDEPYRLFTARAENRLFIREDNSVARMRPFRALLGLNGALDRFQEKFLDDANALEGWVSPKLDEVLKRGDVDPVEVLGREAGSGWDPGVVRTVAVSLKYAGYIRRFERQRKKIQRMAGKTIRWESLAASKHIAHECRQRIRDVRPETFGQLQKIRGIRPATLAYVAGGLV